MNTTEQIQKIIRECALSQAELARASGVAEAVLSRFMAGKRGITTDTLDKLAPVLGLKMTAHRKPPAKGK